jgi:hypothetical protein
MDRVYDKEPKAAVAEINDKRERYNREMKIDRVEEYLDQNRNILDSNSINSGISTIFNFQNIEQNGIQNREIPSLELTLLKQRLEAISVNICSALHVEERQKIVTVSGDSTINIWNSITLENVRTITVQGKIFSGLHHLKNGKIAITLGDSYIEIWDTDPWNKFQTLNSNEKCSAVVQLSNGCIITCAEDYKLRLWQTNRTIYFEFETETRENVKCALEIAPNVIAFGVKGKRRVDIYTFKQKGSRTTLQLLSSLKGSKGTVYDIKLAGNDNQYLLTSEKKSVTLWSLTHQRLLKTFLTNSSTPPLILVVSPNIFVSARLADLDFKTWNIFSNHSHKIENLDRSAGLACIMQLRRGF